MGVPATIPAIAYPFIVIAGLLVAMVIAGLSDHYSHWKQKRRSK